MTRHLLPTRLLPLILLFLSTTGCTNPYTEFYTDLSGGVDVKSVPFVEPPNGEPELVSGTNNDDEFNRLISNGWVAIGYSSFNAGHVDPSMARTHAKQIGAQMVVISGSYQGTTSGIVPLMLPNATTTYNSGTVSGYGGSAMYSGTSTTYGNATSYIPYSVDRYQYTATYWVKRKAGGWGIFCKDLTTDQRRELGTNKGASVANVANNGSAYDADILPGDVILMINGNELRGCMDYQSISSSLIGKHVDVILVRDGERMKIDFLVRPYA